jgi:predicted amidophosphoribosyltransferase
MKMHKSVTPERIMEACERHLSSLDNPGFCIECGADAEGVEPDAEIYICEACGFPAVYGAEQLMFMVF